ncbi:MAG: SurA N-terminal domain-containing protein [Bacteroidales bacterium]|nr:SurA N-terminal domain-containing protein [Bacteroidales bacterium]
MAVLETIRVKFGVVITVLIAVALLSFIVDPSTLQSVTASMSSKYDVGEIDGKAISYTDFQEEVDKYTTLTELMSGSSVQNEQQQISIRNTAWESLVNKYLFVKNAKRAGLTVGEEEMLAIIAGEIESPLISQNPMFFGENGQFSKDVLVQFLNSIDSDATGGAKLYWDNLQSTAQTQQYYAKYMSLFTQSDIVNKLQLTDALAGNNNTFNVEFVMVPFGYAKDTTIVVADADIKKYYESHKKFYKQQAGRDIEYVVYEVKPSAADVAAANEAFAKVYDEFTTTENMKSFLLANSDRKFDNTWYKAGELNKISKEVNDFAFTNGATVSEAITKGNTFSAVRVIASAMVPDSVYVKYVPAASENVDSLLNVAEPMWITQTPGFEDLMTAKVGSQVKLGGFVFNVLKTTTPVAKKRVAILEKNAEASKETVNGYYAQANTLATMAAGKYDTFRKAVDSLGVYAHPVSKMAEGTSRLGAVDGTKEITRWAFEAKKGQVSSIFTINNNYFVVAAVTGIHEEGYTPVNEVASSIRNILYSKQYAEKKSAEVKESIEGLTDLAAIAEKLGTTVSTKDGVAFSSFSSMGLDPMFIGAAYASEDNVICGPVAGNNGVYVYKVTGRETQSHYTEESAKQHSAQRSQYSSQMVVPVMMDDADVKDNRARFY